VTSDKSGNAIKRAIAENCRIRGFHLTFPAPGVIELMALAPIDYVYLDGEHGAFDVRDLEACAIAAELHGITAIARVPDSEPSTIARFLDRGLKGVVVPHVESVDEAKRVIDSAYYGPRGDRSFGGARPLFVAGIPDKTAHLACENENVCVSIMIETVAALAAAGDIAALDGIDYMSFGMMDLAQSLGYPGNPAAAEVKAAVADASARIHAAGKPVREDFITVGWVNDLLLAGAKQVFGDKT
jgi:2-keto-3-deoxy-L-rhamnonate aldolase RhmA